MGWVAESLRAHPELALFLTLAVGNLLGRLRVAGMQLGGVIGVLVAGVVVGQIGIDVSNDLKSAFFLLFLFSIGYKTGPEFFRGLRSSGLPQATVTVVLCGVGLLTSYLVARAFGFDAGTASGMLAGALTESAALGTAGDAIAKLPLDEVAKQELLTRSTVAFAVTYLVGLITVAVGLSRVGPRLLRVNLADECAQLEKEMGMVELDAGALSAYLEHVMRAYELPPHHVACTIADFERGFGEERVFVERVRRGARLLEGEQRFQLRAGDRVVLSGRRELLVGGKNPLRECEVDDRELLDIAVTRVDAVLTRRERAGRPLGALAREVGPRGVFLRKLTRSGQELPFTAGTIVERGDVLTLVGSKENVARVVERLGFAEWPTDATDMVVVGLGVALGGLVGIPALHYGGLELGLSLAVGVLLGGLVAGWLRSVDHRFGRIPEPALWLFDSLGLTAFLALVGLDAGPQFVQGLRESGPQLVLAGVVCAATPHTVALLFGRYVLRMHPGVLLGVCAGGGTAAPALAAVQEVAQSKIPTLGYGVSYAVGNVLLALWGSVMVALMA
jgi:putative transport protein